MQTKRLFAVDLGASGGKCFAGRIDGDRTFQMEEVHRFAHEGVPFFIADRTGAVTERTCWDDTYIYQQIIKGLQACRRASQEPLDAIGIDTWGADGAVITADGEPLGKIHCYRDHRLDGMVAEIKNCLSPERIYAITGVHFQPFNLSNQLRWFATRRKDLLRHAAHYLPIPTVFYHYLGGCTQVDSSWASITQLMDARRHRWSRELLKAFGIPARLLPAIVEPGARIGRLHPALAAAVGINEAELIAVGSHDTASAFAAAPVRDTRTALIISSGTWSLVGRLVKKPITTPDAMAANISNEGGIGNTRLLKNCMGTWIVQELLRVWEIADGRRMPWSEVDRIAPAAAAFQAFIDPDDAGFYNPANMESAIREFLAATGQAPPADRGAILRIVYESLALKYRYVNAQICEICGTPTRVVHIVGGGSSNVMLNQFTADAMNLPVLAGPKEATAIGNLMVQAMGTGIIPDMAAAQPIIRQAFPIREFLPGDTAAWDAAYARFRRLQAAGSPRK